MLWQARWRLGAVRARTSGARPVSNINDILSIEIHNDIVFLLIGETGIVCESIDFETLESCHYVRHLVELTAEDEDSIVFLDDDLNRRA